MSSDRPPFAMALQNVRERHPEGYLCHRVFWQPVEAIREQRSQPFRLSFLKGDEGPGEPVHLSGPQKKIVRFITNHWRKINKLGSQNSNMAAKQFFSL